MQITLNRTKSHLILSILFTVILSSAAEVGLLSKYYTKNVYEASFLFLIMAFIGLLFVIYFYRKAKQEDEVKK